MSRITVETVVPQIGLGCATLGNLGSEMSDEQAAEILESAWAAGIRHFDTAPHYGLGLSEARLGRFLVTKPRDEFVVSTKAGRLIRPNPAWDGRQDDEGFTVTGALRREWDFSELGVRTSLEESLARLGLESVDVLYLHDPEIWDLEGGLKSGMPALGSIRDEGLVRAIGVGSMSSETLLAAARTGLADLLMVAGRYTLADQSIVPEVLDACRETGSRIVAAAVFNSGLLSGAPAGSTTYDYGAVPADKVELVRRIAEVCGSYDIDVPTAALHFPLRSEMVAGVILGAANGDQVRQNVERLAATVPDELFTTLEAEGLVR